MQPLHACSIFNMWVWPNNASESYSNSNMLVRINIQGN